LFIFHNYPPFTFELLEIQKRERNNRYSTPLKTNPEGTIVILSGLVAFSAVTVLSSFIAPIF